jgi:hypothetical protein
MNVDFAYPTSGVTDNQLRTFDHIGLFSNELPNTPDMLEAVVDPFYSGKPVVDRARSYLSVNCAMCHRPGAPSPASVDLRWEATLQEMNVIGVPPTLGDLGVSDARIIAPGDVSRSIMHNRMDRRGNYQMPPLATSRADDDAITLLEEWINELLAEPGQSWMLY